MKRAYAILFVCTGNTCRSPMAEAIARAELKRSGITGVKVWSRGLARDGGMETAGRAVSALMKLGIELDPRPSQSLTPKDLEEADMILTMTAEHKERLAADWPGSVGKAFVLSEFSGTERGDVRDPMGGPDEEYDKCAARLKDEITEMMPKLRRTLSRRRYR